MKKIIVSLFLFFSISIANANWISSSVVSSFINTVYYNTETRQMIIEMNNGKAYSYCHVPYHVYIGFTTSYSKGSYYNSYIKGMYYCY